ncbi:MAG TPA: hypothetical protein VGE95_03280 [Arthrobacter sp.]
MNYRNSAISRDGTPKASGWPRPGERLPDAVVSVDGRVVRLHELTAVPGIHLLLGRDAGPVALGASRSFPAVDSQPRLLHVHRLTSHPGAGIVAVRPDGYVGFRCGEADPVQLLDWLRLVGAVRDQGSLPPS